MGEQSKDLDNLGQVHLLSFFLLDTGEPEKIFLWDKGSIRALKFHFQINKSELTIKFHLFVSVCHLLPIAKYSWKILCPLEMTSHHFSKNLRWSKRTQWINTTVSVYDNQNKWFSFCIMIIVTWVFSNFLYYTINNDQWRIPIYWIVKSI